MHRLGRITVWAGIVLVAAGLGVGFTALWQGSEGLGITALGLVPVGFLLLLAGTVACQLAGPGRRYPGRGQDPGE